MTDEEKALGVSPTLSTATTVDNGLNLNHAQQAGRTDRGGYYKLAEFMAAYPEAAIFHRFKKLHIVKLLYLQAELTGLETILLSYAAKDEQSSDRDRRDYCRNYFKLKYSVGQAGSIGEKGKQINAWERLSAVLKEYDETLMHMRTVLNMPRIKKQELSILRGWMLNDGNICLTGSDKDIWDTVSDSNLLALRGSEYDDRVTKWMNEKVLLWYNKFVGRYCHKAEAADNPCAGTISYKQKNIAHVLSLLVFTFASGMPIAAVSVLYETNSYHLRMGLMAVFTCAFSTILTWVSGGSKKLEVLGASAAFAAVLVVLVGNQTLPSSN